MKITRSVYAALLLLALCVFASCNNAGSGNTTPSSVAGTLDSASTQALTNALNAYVPATVTGVGMMLSSNDTTTYLYAKGNLTTTSIVALASASKLPSATAIMTLVDQGKLKLDQPISSYLTGHVTWPTDKASVTMHMLLAHTSGLAQDKCISDQKNETLQTCTQKIANDRLVFQPGSNFSYEGADYQVAGYVAEVVSGQSWKDFFNTALAQPLGMKTFTYGKSANPRIAGGASSNMDDYTRLLQMHLANGVYHGQRILSQNAIDLMRKDNIGNLHVRQSPGAKEHLNGYGLGLWVSDACLYPGSPGPEYSDQGAFGYTPWIDLGLKYTGVIMIKSRITTGTQLWSALRPLIIKGLTGTTPAASACTK